MNRPDCYTEYQAALETMAELERLDEIEAIQRRVVFAAGCVA